MLKRFVALIDSEGYQGGLTLASNPEETTAKMREIAELSNDRAAIIYIFENDAKKFNPKNYDFKTFKDNYINKRQKQLAIDDDSMDPGNYMAYELRKRYTNGNMQTEVFYAATKQDNEDMISRNPYEAAFHILDLCIVGKTTLNRFNKRKNKIIFGKELNKDFDKKKDKFKKLRKIMMGYLKQEEEEPDEI